MIALAGRIVLTLAVAWTQFRLGPQNNAVVDGTLNASWRIETGGQISASPTMVDGTVYVGNNNGSLYAIEATTGKVLWSARVPNPLMSAPLIYNDLVIVGEGDPTSRSSSPSEPVMVGQGASALIGFDRFSGSMRWQTTVSGSAMPTPAIIGGTLIDHDGAGWINGLDPASGEMRYQHWLGSMASMSAILPIGNGDFVTTGVGSNAAWRLHADGGSIIWRSPFSRGASGIGDCPPVTDGRRDLLRLRLAGAARYVDGHRRSNRGTSLRARRRQRRKLVGRRLGERRASDP